MNNRTYRLVFNRIRNMLVAVEETANHLALLGLLAETSRVLGADLDLSTLLVKLMALAEKMLGAEASSVMLLDESRTTLRWEVAEGDVTAGADSTVRITAASVPGSTGLRTQASHPPGGT